jgi:phenylacetate-CoA ligase
LRGGYIGTINNIYKYLSTTKQYLFSSYYFNSDTYSIYINAFLKTKATTLEAYPSQAFELAKLVIDNNDINLLKFSFILLGSENLYDWQLDIIKKAFPNSKIFSWYGNAEKNVLAQWSENNDKYYINPFYGFTELLNNEANLSENSTLLEIVGTSFWMKTTPFIRYKTLDLALENKDLINFSNRHFDAVEKIIGREQEFIYSNKRKIPISSINMHNNIFDNVSQFQFYQEMIGIVILKIIPKISFNDYDRNLIYTKVYEKLGVDFKLEILLVNEIQLNKNYKFKFLDQRIKNE